MYQQQQQQAQQMQYLAGVCLNAVDQSSFNPNLPNQNDAVPQLQATQWLQQPQSQQMYAMALGIFRLRLQERAMRSPMHSWAYNQISANRFQNQVWNDWANRLAGFLEYISVVPSQAQQNPPNVAVPKAADTMFKCYLATCVTAQPQLFHFVAQDQTMVNELQKYGQLINAIMQDVQTYRNNGMASQQQPQFVQQAGYGQLPAIQPGYMQNSYQQQYQQPAPLQTLAVQNQPAYAPAPMAMQGSTGAGSTGMDYGVPEAEPKPMATQSVLGQPNKPLNPVETYGVSVAPVNTVAPVAPAYAPEELDRPVPTDARSVIMDPHYHTPPGFTVDEERPFDIIHSPGGVITRPAYQVPDWTVTRNDSFVYTQLVDPSRYIRFYTKWPDGVVQESIIEITEMMKYAAHEIDADLRAAAHVPDGVVRRTQLAVHKEINNMKPITEVKELMLTDEHQPIRMTVEFQGSTDMENEVEARRVLRADLNLGKDDTLPSHEYLSSRTHMIDLDEDSFEALMTTIDSNDLAAVAKDFVVHRNKGLLTQREFNFINKRLTDETNAYLKDAMSQDVRIDNFCEDVIPLLDYLATVDGNYVKLLKDATALLLSRSVQLHRSVDEDKNVSYSINDTYVNLQTGWNIGELSDGKLSDEAQLVSAYTHQALIDAVKGMFGRASAAERILNRFRVVTLDGAYLEIFKGALVQNAFMFKRVA